MTVFFYKEDFLMENLQPCIIVIGENWHETVTSGDDGRTLVTFELLVICFSFLYTYRNYAHKLTVLYLQIRFHSFWFTVKGNGCLSRFPEHVADTP